MDDEYNSTWWQLDVLCICISFVGWILLNSSYESDNGAITPAHYVGTGMFMVAGLVYFISMMCNIYSRRGTHWIQFIVIVAVIFLSSLTGVAFITMHFIDICCGNWIFEHITLALFAFAHALFFTVDTPNIWEDCDKNPFENVKIVAN
jgi:hypothetical protein